MEKWNVHVEYETVLRSPTESADCIGDCSADLLPKGLYF